MSSLPAAEGRFLLMGRRDRRGIGRVDAKAVANGLR